MQVRRRRVETVRVGDVRVQIYRRARTLAGHRYPTFDVYDYISGLRLLGSPANQSRPGGSQVDRSVVRIGQMGGGSTIRSGGSQLLWVPRTCAQRGPTAKTGVCLVRGGGWGMVLSEATVR